MLKAVLIVEDEAVLRDLLSQRLSQEGYAVEIAKDGEEGLRIMRESNPDLVLLDIVMPKLDGFEVLRFMNNDPRLRRIPVVVISNSGQMTELELAKELGARDVLIKTEFDPREVIDKVRQYI